MPTAYRFPGDDERYMIGSEVGSRLDLFKGALYKKFPKLWKRVVTKDEKLILAELGVSNRVLANWELMCIKAADGEAILRGEGDKFRGQYAPKGRLVASSPCKKRELGIQSHSQPKLNPKKLLKGGEAEIHLAPIMNSFKVNEKMTAIKRRKDMKKRAELRSLICPVRYHVSFRVAYHY